MHSSFIVFSIITASKLTQTVLLTFLNFANLHLLNAFRLFYYIFLKVCDLIEKKNPAGILAFLDEESIYPNGSDDTLMKKYQKNLMKHKHFDVPNSKVRSQSTDRIFVIKHFAGDVSYNVEGFLEKNRDTLFRDLIDAAGSSSKPYVQDLFPEFRKQASKKRPPTAGNQFKVSMTDLVKTLMACTPHYVRCMKPNDEKRSGMYNVDRVTHQVKYLGTLFSIKLKKR